MDGQSLNITAETIKQLKALLPDVFSEDKIDIQRLKQALGEDTFVKGEHYELSWAGKSEARKEVQKQTTATLVPDRENSIDFDNAQNVFIEGENLEVLRVLQKSYFGKVKMIYIDPPYNTGNDSFVYPDDYTERQAEYNKRTGITDEEGFLNKQDLWKRNSKENGQFHSVWLSMMYPRLYLSRNLLREDGVIFISIDDNEAANLKLLCDEIFGEENFVGNIVWNSTKSVTNTALISVSHNHNLVYFKNIDFLKKNRVEFRLPEDGEGFTNFDNDKRGAWKADPFQVGGWRPNQQYEIINPKTGEKYLPNPGCSWKNDFEKYKELLKDNRIVFGINGESGPQRKRFLTEALERGKVSKTLWTDVGTTANGTQTLKKLFANKNVFTNPKPVDLIQRMLQLGTAKDEQHIVLDFFAGSGTTAQSLLELNEIDGGNRQFILIQMPEVVDTKNEAFALGYKTIADITKARIQKTLNDINHNRTEKSNFNHNSLVGFQSYVLRDSNFKIWQNEIKGKEQIALQLFKLKQVEKTNSDTDKLFVELCLKVGLKLNVKYKIENKFYKTDNKFWFCFEPFHKNILEEIFKERPEKVFFLNSCFRNDAQLTNFKSESSEFNIQII